MNPESRHNARLPRDACGAEGKRYDFAPEFSAGCDALFNPAPLPSRTSAEVEAFQKSRLSFLLYERFGDAAPTVVYLGTANHVGTGPTSESSLSRPFIAGFAAEHQQESGQLSVGFYVPETDEVRLVNNSGLRRPCTQLVSALQLCRFLETARNCHEGLIPLFLDFQITGREYLELDQCVAPRSLTALTHTPLLETEACLEQCHSLGISVCSDDIFRGIANGVAPLSCLRYLPPLVSLQAAMKEREIPAVIHRLVEETRQRVLFFRLPRYSDQEILSRHPWADAHAELICAGLPQFRMTVIGEGSGVQRVEDFIHTFQKVSKPVIAHAQSIEKANELWAGARQLPQSFERLRGSIATLTSVGPLAHDRLKGVVAATEALVDLERTACGALRTLVRLHHLGSVEVDDPGPQKQLECAVGAAAGLVTCTRRELDRFFPGLFSLPK